jgi:hypothetical protein
MPVKLPSLLTLQLTAGELKIRKTKAGEIFPEAHPERVRKTKDGREKRTVAKTSRGLLSRRRELHSWPYSSSNASNNFGKNILKLVLKLY